MGFTETMTQNCMDIWEGYLTHPFLTETADGSLPEEKMLHYMIQDSLYLKEYAKIFALGIAKAETMTEMQEFHRMIAGIVQGEYPTRDHYLSRFSSMPIDWEKASPAKENRAYTGYMRAQAEQGGIPELLAATLPCALSYAYIGKTLVSRDPGLIANGKYGELIGDYAGTVYQDACVLDRRFADRLFEPLDAGRKEKLMGIYRESSIHEMHFWDMAYRPETGMKGENAGV